MTSALTAGLPPLEIAPRIPVLQRSLEEAPCTTLLVTDLLNIRWLTGFTGSRAMLVVGPGQPVLITDARYDEQAAAELAQAGVDAAIVISRDEGPAVAAAAAGAPCVGLEADSVSWSLQQRIDASWLPDTEIVATSGLVAALRRSKDPGEVARISAAAAVADEALRQVGPLLASGCTERELRDELESRMRVLGATGPAFETIVAAGPNASLPHARPTDRVVGVDEMVIVDVGAVVDGYHSDMTRTMSAGSPDSFGREVWETVVAAQAAGVAAVAPGVPACDVDRRCREVIEAAGWGDNFIHGTGHGVGLQIHEDPWLGASTTEPLAEGDVITVEPGIYLPQRIGVRIEDTVVVTADGCAALTHTEKRLSP